MATASTCACYSLCYSKRADEGGMSRRRRKRQRCDQQQSGLSGPERERKDSYKEITDHTDCMA